MTAETASMRDHWWWRPGWTVGRRFYTWHLTFAGQTDVHRLARQYRTALAPCGDALTPIPDRWLHLTMQGIGFTDEVDERDVRAVVAAARGHLARVPAFDVRIGSAVLDPEAVLLPVRPEGPVRAVRDSIRPAIGDVLPEVPEKQAGFTPHVSVAYSAGDGPSEPVSRSLAGFDPTPAQAHISGVEEHRNENRR